MTKDIIMNILKNVDSTEIKKTLNTFKGLFDDSIISDLEKEIRSYKQTKTDDDAVNSVVDDSKITRIKNQIICEVPGYDKSELKITQTKNIVKIIGTNSYKSVVLNFELQDSEKIMKTELSKGLLIFNIIPMFTSTEINID